MELHGEPWQHLWAYRKAAWSIEDAPHDLGMTYRQMGVNVLERIENVGTSLAAVAQGVLVKRSQPSGKVDPCLRQELDSDRSWIVLMV